METCIAKGENKMNTQQRKKYLEALADNEFKTPYNQVFHFEFNGSHYEAATNGFLLTAFRIAKGDFDAERQMPQQQDGKMKNALIRKPTCTVEWNSLWQFLRGDECSRCPACKGTGKRSEMIVDAENGFPDEFTNRGRYVRIGGHQINGNLLAWHLAALPEAQTLMVTMPVKDGSRKPPPFVFWADSWLLMIQTTIAENHEVDGDFDELKPIELHKKVTA